MSAHDALVSAGMTYYGWRYWRPLDRAAAQPRQAQLQVLRRILAANASAEFGERHGFRAIRSAADYAAQVPVQEYEHLRPYVERQRTTGEPALTQEAPALYAQTSGSTGTPKYVPITPSVLAVHRAEQKIFSYLQYRACPAAFSGRTLPAAECLELGLVNKVVPHDLFEKEVRALADEIAANAPLAVQAIKRMMRLGLEDSFESNVHQVYLQLLPLFRTRDFQEGVKAFLEGRAPQFEGR